MTALLLISMLLQKVPSVIQEKPSVEAVLEKARVEFDLAMDKARADYASALNSKIHETAQTGNLSAVKQLRSEKEEFESDGKLPTTESVDVVTFNATCTELRKQWLGGLADKQVTKEMRVK